MKNSLSRRIYLYFVIVIVLTSASIGITGYWRSSAEMENQYQQLLAQIVENVAHQTDLYLTSTERATLSILTSPIVKDVLDAQDMTVSDRIAFDNLIKEQVFQTVLINNPEITLVYLAGYNGFMSKDFNTEVVRFNNLAFDSYIEQLKSGTRDDGGITIQDSGFLEGHLTITRKLSKRQTSRQYNGIMGFELRVGELTKLWKGIRLGQSGYFFIVNDRGKIIYHPDAGRIGKQLNGSQYEMIQANSDNVFELPGEQGRLFFGRKSDFSGWTLVASMSLSEQREPIATLRQTTLIVALCTLVIAFFLAFQFGQTIIRPIRRLESGMRQTEKGQWTRVDLTGSADEVDRLIGSYNTMVARLEELINQVYETELRNQENMLKRQRAEFQSLQMQINPHFLFNTMETVVCYAVIRNSSEIKDIIRSLSYMLRYSIRTDLEKITVVNELKHVLHFMQIMNYRFSREFELDVRIPPDLLLGHMVRLTLQPIVENVFKHAFPNGIADTHTIIIDAWREEDDFYVSVEDNGEGMSEEALRQLRDRLQLNSESDGLESSAGGSIGLSNVHTRIQMVFGGQYGLLVDSVAGQGTRVRMRMPNDKKEQPLQA